MELVKEYNCGLNYHPGKANVVADALSQRTLHLSVMMIKGLGLIEQLRDMCLVARWHQRVLCYECWKLSMILSIISKNLKS